jgi:hypothetical protein
MPSVCTFKHFFVKEVDQYAHPFLIASFIVRIAVLVVLIWGAYTLAQIHKTLQAAKQVTRQS